MRLSEPFVWFKLKKSFLKLKCYICGGEKLENENLSKEEIKKLKQ